MCLGLVSELIQVRSAVQKGPGPRQAHDVVAALKDGCSTCHVDVECDRS